MKTLAKTTTTAAIAATLLCGTVAPAQALDFDTLTTPASTVTGAVVGWSWWGNWWGGTTKEATVETHTAKHTATGMTLDATVRNYDGKLTLRASAKPLTGQTGWYVTGYPGSDDRVKLQLTKFDNTAKRYWQLETSTGKVLVSGSVSAPVTTPKPTPAPIKPAPTPAPSTPVLTGQKKTGFITGYAIHDNDPYGSKGIAYSKEWNTATVHTEAGGTGTYDDPITIAAPKDTYAPGTRIYLPHVDRYGVVEDLCATSWTATSGCTSVLDLWVGGEMSDSADDTRKCNEKITGTYEFIVNPSRGYPVTVGPLFNSKTDTCATVTR